MVSTNGSPRGELAHSPTIGPPMAISDAHQKCFDASVARGPNNFRQTVSRAEMGIAHRSWVQLMRSCRSAGLSRRVTHFRRRG
jgi:hypothetical protein